MPKLRKGKHYDHLWQPNRNVGSGLLVNGKRERDNIMITETTIATLLATADEAFSAVYEAEIALATANAAWVTADAAWTKAKAEADEAEADARRRSHRKTMTESESAVHCDNYWDRRFTNEDKGGTP